MIYQPDFDRIQEAADRLRTKYSTRSNVIDRIDRAAALVHERAVDIQRHRFVVWSPNAVDGYTITEDGCTCQDFYEGAPHIDGKPYCKHRFAMAIYRQILAEEISKRILGNAERANRRRQKSHPNRYLILTERGHLWSDHNGDLGEVRYHSDIYRAVTPEGALNMAQWLHDAQPLPEPKVRLPEDLLPTGSYDPAWTRQQYNQYLATGELPSHQRAWQKDSY